MKNSIACLLLYCICSCNNKQISINFSTVSPSEFNAAAVEMPDMKTIDSLKHAHDSCMGFSFDANVFLAARKDFLFIGSIVNRQTLQPVSTLKDLGFDLPQLVSTFNMKSQPCYDKQSILFSLKQMFGDKFFETNFKTMDAALSKEINELLLTADAPEMQTGSWLYLDMKFALNNLLDSTTNPRLLSYKKNLLDSTNMVLTSMQSVTDVSFLVSTKKEMSPALQLLLQSKPTSTGTGSPATIKLFYISSNQFQMNISGFFPVMGKFMKASIM